MPRIPTDFTRKIAPPAQVRSVQLNTGALQQQAENSRRGFDAAQQGINTLVALQRDHLDRQYKSDMILGQEKYRELSARRDEEIASIPVDPSIDYNKEVQKIIANYNKEWQGWTKTNIRNQDRTFVERDVTDLVNQFGVESFTQAAIYEPKYHDKRNLSLLDGAKRDAISRFDKEAVTANYDERVNMGYMSREEADVAIAESHNIIDTNHDEIISQQMQLALLDNDLKTFRENSKLLRTVPEAKRRELVRSQEIKINEDKRKDRDQRIRDLTDKVTGNSEFAAIYADIKALQYNGEMRSPNTFSTIRKDIMEGRRKGFLMRWSGRKDEMDDKSKQTLLDLLTEVELGYFETDTIKNPILNKKYNTTRFEAIKSLQPLFKISEGNIKQDVFKSRNQQSEEYSDSASRLLSAWQNVVGSADSLSPLGGIDDAYKYSDNILERIKEFYEFNPNATDFQIKNFENNLLKEIDDQARMLQLRGKLPNTFEMQSKQQLRRGVDFE